MPFVNPYWYELDETGNIYHVEILKLSGRILVTRETETRGMREDPSKSEDLLPGTKVLPQFCSS